MQGIATPWGANTQVEVVPAGNRTHRVPAWWTSCAASKRNWGRVGSDRGPGWAWRQKNGAQLDRMSCSHSYAPRALNGIWSPHDAFGGGHTDQPRRRTLHLDSHRKGRTSGADGGRRPDGRILLGRLFCDRAERRSCSAHRKRAFGNQGWPCSGKIELAWCTRLFIRGRAKTLAAKGDRGACLCS